MARLALQPSRQTALLVDWTETAPASEGSEPFVDMDWGPGCANVYLEQASEES